MCYVHEPSLAEGDIRSVSSDFVPLDHLSLARSCASVYRNELRGFNVLLSRTARQSS